MNRLHVNLGVTDLDASIHFYSGLFGAPPPPDTLEISPDHPVAHRV
mgnify:FL=1